MVTQDNDKFSFTTLGAATANVVRWLDTDKKQNEDRGSDPNPADADKECAEDQRRYVDQRLREIASWERKISGRRE